jgi:virulence factor Mce-like protein
MRAPRTALRDLFDNPVLVGALTILVVVVAVYLSYVAENGIPFLPTYDINVQVADGGELNKNVDVRIGGARVGQVLKIIPTPANRSYPHPFATVQLQLEKSLEPLPADTHYQVRLSSVLGGQYIELFPGRAERQTVPPGGTLTISADPALNHNIPYVDLSQAFAVFGPRTQAGLRSITADLGDAFAGRGAQLNDAIRATGALIGPLDRLLTLLATPATNLSGFIGGFASTTAALQPVAGTLGPLFRDAANTFGALNVPALGTTINALPGTEAYGAQVLNASLPELTQLADIATQLRPAAAYLPTAARNLDVALRQAPTTFRLLPGLAAGLDRVLATTQTVARDPSAAQALGLLGTNDLGTAGASVFVGLGAILNSVTQQQYSCNVVGQWVRGFASSLSDGNSAGNWLRVNPVLDFSHLIAGNSTQPNANLHINANPVESGGQCQAGNETYTGTQAIDRPTVASDKVDNTAPPAGVYQLGQRAGLVP